MTKFTARSAFLIYLAILWLLRTLNSIEAWLTRALLAVESRIPKQHQPQPEQPYSDPAIAVDLRSMPEPAREQCDSEAVYQSALKHWQHANSASPLS